MIADRWQRRLPHHPPCATLLLDEKRRLEGHISALDREAKGKNGGIGGYTEKENEGHHCGN